MAFSSVAQSCPTLCDPVDCNTPGFTVHHQLLELAQTHVHRVSDAIQPSHPLLSPSPPAFNLAQHQGLLQSQFFASGGQSIGVSASASVLPMNIHWPIPFMVYTVSISYVPFTVLSTLCIFIHGIHTTPLRNWYFYPFFQIAETKTQKVREVVQGQMSIKSELKPKPGSNPRYLSLDMLLLLSSCQVVSNSL